MHQDSRAALSTQERANPPPRRKSCGACVKAKRRCDFALPACVRCTQRKIPCEYPPRATVRRQRATALHPVDESDNSERTAGSTSLEFDVTAEQVHDNDLIGLDAVDLEFSTAEVDSGISDRSPFDSPMEMPDCSLVGQSTAMRAPRFKSLSFTSDLIKNRLQFAVDLIRRSPKMMVTEMQTAWCHPQVYAKAMPRTMQDAVSSCALYNAKTPTNAAIIFNIIDARVADLIAAPSPGTLLDALAETQALILYQIIRLFDGDIAARASGERLIAFLERAAVHLLTFVQFDADSDDAGQLLLYPVADTRAFWENWVLQETARRTAVTAFFFLQAYRTMDGSMGHTCDGKLALCSSWTLSAPLWDAQSPVEFARAVKAKRYFVVAYDKMYDWISEARADDIDLFGKLWISSLLGIQEMEGWFASRRESLRAEAVSN